jgi:DNA-binding NtrC family response regulator
MRLLGWDFCLVSQLRGKGRVMILIVEDEFLINWTITEELQLQGCEVISAFNADEAILILQSRADIEVVFTDIDMPGSMDGLRLAVAIRDRWPPIQVIVTSGKATPSVLPQHISFLAKPYTVNDIVRRVEQYCA